MKGVVQIKPVNIDDLTNDVFSDGKLRSMPWSYYRQFDLNKLLFFMHQKGLYILPTWELIDWLRSNIIGQAIEICAGNGSLGRFLNIPRTDSRLQEREDIRLYYQLMGQPVITYPDDVEKLEASRAVARYQPDTVVASYVTHRFDPKSNTGNADGPDEESILGSVKRYMMVGNLETHRDKPLLKKKHVEYFFPWLICRAYEQSENRIFVWDNPKNK